MASFLSFDESCKRVPYPRPEESNMFSFAEMKQEQIRFGEKYQLVQLNNQSQV